MLLVNPARGFISHLVIYWASELLRSSFPPTLYLLRCWFAVTMCCWSCVRIRSVPSSPLSCVYCCPTTILAQIDRSSSLLSFAPSILTVTLWTRWALHGVCFFVIGCIFGHLYYNLHPPTDLFIFLVCPRLVKCFFSCRTPPPTFYRSSVLPSLRLSLFSCLWSFESNSAVISWLSICAPLLSSCLLAL